MMGTKIAKYMKIKWNLSVTDDYVSSIVIRSVLQHLRLGVLGNAATYSQT